MPRIRGHGEVQRAREDGENFSSMRGKVWLGKNEVLHARVGIQESPSSGGRPLSTLPCSSSFEVPLPPSCSGFCTGGLGYILSQVVKLGQY